MGIRMLHRRPAGAQGAAPVPVVPPAPVPAHAATASTARIPADLVATLRRTAHRTAAGLRRRLTTPGEPPLWRLWAGLGRSYAAGCAVRARHAAVRLLRRGRHARTFPVFVVAAGPLTDRPDGPTRR
ncbi:hypothetical protein ABZZ74_03475 [Streptomyces sp. NPDC006476]|uniref:hypothetical protein n=1 Tax=Streptomyces sp. NPDC006476 TaxID=3157175 RepID=UPI0033AE5F2D